MVDDPGDADFVALPMVWSYYLWNERRNMKEADDLAQLARTDRKQLIIWHKGDLVPIVHFEDAIVFLPGIVRSRMRANQRSCPAFVNDPAEVSGYPEPPYREKKTRPSVGFCGYASVSPLKIAWSVVKGVQLNVLSRLGRYDFEGVPLIPPTFLRSRALTLLSRDARVDANFIIRDRHTQTAAQDRSMSRAKAESDFYSNIYETDYNLCVRGYGNWSYRFYETLACGRIPVFIDTDCVLPAVPNVNWKEYCVWIDRSEIEFAPEKLADFHSAMSPTQFVELQKACRELWKKHLTLEGFMADIQAHLRRPL